MWWGARYAGTIKVSVVGERVPMGRLRNVNSQVHYADGLGWMRCVFMNKYRVGFRLIRLVDENIVCHEEH